MTKKQWSDKFEKDNGRKPTERELKVAKQSDYKIDTDIQLIKGTKLSRSTTTTKKNTAKKAEKTVTAEDLVGKNEDVVTTTAKSSNKGLKIILPIVGGVLVLLLAGLLIFGGGSKDKSDFYMTSPDVKKTIKDALETGLGKVDDLKVKDLKVKQVESTKDDEEPEYTGSANIKMEAYSDIFDRYIPIEGKIKFTIEDTKDTKSSEDEFYLTITDFQEK